jgi:hypothetical protein
VNHLDLFSGLGGFALGARAAGWKTVAFCEIDPFCQDVLNRHWPSVPIISDVSMLSPQAIPVLHLAPPLEDATTPATGGLKREASFDAFDPFGSSLKTCLELGLSTLIGRAVTSKVSAMPSGRLMLQLRSETTSGVGYGLWPTPTATANHNAPSMRKWPSYARQQDAGGISPSRWEWMMGFPIGHTAFTRWATRSLRRSRK